MCEHCDARTFENEEFEPLREPRVRHPCEEIVEFGDGNADVCGLPAKWVLLATGTDDHLCDGHKAAFVAELMGPDVAKTDKVAKFVRESLRPMKRRERCEAMVETTLGFCGRRAGWVSITTYEIYRCREHKDAERLERVRPARA